MKFYFCYEQGTTGLWSPVLYHNEPPSKREQRNATEVVAYDLDFEPSFKWFTDRQPLERYITVVRPVEGFQTKDGHFFETEVEAEIHETTYSLSRAFYEFVKGSEIDSISPEQKDYVISSALNFLQQNRSDIILYLQATQKYEDSQPKPSPTEAVVEEQKAQVA